MSYLREALDRMNNRPRRGYETIVVEPITPVVGAEISGVDLTGGLHPQQVREIRQALLDHHVVVFRGQPLSVEDHKRVGRYFGELRQFPIAKIDGGDPEYIDAYANKNSRHVVGSLWHTDGTADAEPSMGSLLYMMEAPEVGGGDTMFANMHLAYEMLSPAMQTFLESLTAVHDGIVPWRGIKPPEGYPVAKSEHPVVIRHPETGRKILFVSSGFTTRIVGMSAFESRQLLDMLFRMIEQEPILACRIRWQKDTLVFWDNRCTQHFAVWDYFPFNRHVRRVTVNGTRPTA